MRTFEVSLFRVDEFAKLDEFDEKLPVHGLVENILMITNDKIHISPGLSFYIDLYFPFYYFTTNYSTQIAQINLSN